MNEIYQKRHIYIKRDLHRTSIQVHMQGDFRHVRMKVDVLKRDVSEKRRV